MPLGKPPRPDHRQIYFQPIIGPMTIIYYHATAKLEAKCRHLGCGWSYFYWQENDCKSALLKHLWEAHFGQPKPISNERLPMPGG